MKIRVIDETTKQDIEGVEVTLLNNEYVVETAITNADGEAEFKTTKPYTDIAVQKIGYYKDKVNKNHLTYIGYIEMQPDPTFQLAPLVVTTPPKNIKPVPESSKTTWKNWLPIILVGALLTGAVWYYKKKK